MARLYLSPIATGSAKLAPRTRPTRMIIQTEFDWESTWAAACQRDEEVGEREACEDPDDLVSNPDEDPVDILGFSSGGEDDMCAEDADDGSDDEFNAAAASPSLANSAATPSSPSVATFTFPTHGFPTVITPNPSSLPIPGANASMSKPTNEGSEGGTKRKRGAGAKQANRDRKDQKKKREWEARKREEMPPVHGEPYVRRYLRPDVVNADIDVLELKAVKGGDTGINKKRPHGQKGVPRSLPEAISRGYGYFPWDGE